MPPSRDKLAIRLLEPEIRIPGGIEDLESFRSWTRCPSFPERGRIDWIQGCLEVDVSPEDLTTHGMLKSAIASRLAVWVQDLRLGAVFIDRARISHLEANLSAEPDVVVLLESSLLAGQARMMATSAERAAAGRFIELEGAPDLVVEVVSDSSTTKDRQRLKAAYHRAGIPEYWIVDGRTEPPGFELLWHRPGGYEPSPTNSSGYRNSPILQRDVRIVRNPGRGGLIYFELEAR